MCARRGRVGCSDVASGSLDFPCAPSVRTVITSRGGDSALPGVSVGPELPGDKEQSNSPR